MNKKKIIVLIFIALAVIATGAFGVHRHNVKAEEQKRIEKEEAQKAEEEKVAREEGKHMIAGLKGSAVTKVMQGEEYVESGAFCTHDISGPVSNVEIKGKVDTDKPGTYEVQYTFREGKGIKTIKRTVQVIPEKDFKKNTEGIPVLMYHYVYTESDTPENLNGNYIKDTDLDEQMKYFVENDYYFPSFAELRAYNDGKLSLPEKSAIVTFDDGQYGFLAYGIPVIEKYKIPAVSFVIGTREGESRMMDNLSPYVNYQSHSYDMHRPGGNIGHGGVISALSKEEIKEDLKMMAEITGSDDAFAYPFGDVTDTAEEAVRENKILCAFTTENDKVYPGMDAAALPRVRVQGYSSLLEWASTL